MLVCMLLVVGRSSPRSPRGRTWRKSAGSAALRRACLFFVSVVLFCRTIIISFPVYFCVRLRVPIETPRHDNVKQLVWSPPS